MQYQGITLNARLDTKYIVRKKTFFRRNLLQLLFNNLTKLNLNIIQYNCAVSSVTFETIYADNINAMCIGNCVLITGKFALHL